MFLIQDPAQECLHRLVESDEVQVLVLSAPGASRVKNLIEYLNLNFRVRVGLLVIGHQDIEITNFLFNFRG